MSEVPTVLKEQRLVESYDADVVRRLRPQALLGYLLDAAWKHANLTVYGYEQLSARNMIWVLLKARIVIRRQPMWQERVEIETWGKRIERLYAFRDFVLSSPSGEKLVSATTSWIVLDRTSGRPQRLDAKTDGFPWQPARSELEPSAEKVPELNDAKALARFRVHFSDIDLNGHVSSARYLQWIVDAHPHELLVGRDLAAIELSFLAEALQDDEVVVLSEIMGDRELCAVRRVPDDKELCRAALQWRIQAP